MYLNSSFFSPFIISQGGVPGTGYNPPALINTMISMALSPGSVKDPLYGRVVLPDAKTGWPSNYTVCGDPAILCCRANGCGQASIQLYLLLAAFLSVPVLLCCKPCILNSRNKAKKAARERSDSPDSLELAETKDDGLHQPDSPGGNSGGGHGGHHEEGFGDLMIHQIIETIEFVLGFISNTASYLRLWALSLAHAELAEVFWSKTMGMAIGLENFFFVFCAWGAFAAVTIGVLLMMDVLECFLHALRLHWVEFMNKFYYADGYAFDPFDLRAMRGTLQE